MTPTKNQTTVTKTFQSTFTYDAGRAARHFVATFKQLLKEIDVPRAQLCEAVGVKERTVRSWLTEGVLPSEENITKVKDTLQAEAQAARDFADAVTRAFGA